jgi:integrase/recombinase XerD
MAAGSELAPAPPGSSGIYQASARPSRTDITPHRFRNHFSHTWPDNGGAEGDLTELNGWACPQMPRRYGASARNARALRHYDHITGNST